MIFPELNPNSKVWIYTADRELNDDEVQTSKIKLKTFISEWAAHGNELFGNATILHNQFVVLAVDESKVMASGCSIDSSVRFIKELGAELGVDFFNRLFVIIQSEGGNKRVHISELSGYKSDAMFDPMIQTLSQLNNQWIIPVESSPFA